MRRLVVFMATLAISTMACAQPSGDKLGAGAVSKSVEVTRRATGRTVRLAKGDRLVLRLAEEGSQARWALARYPKKQLVLSSSDRATSRYEFDAEMSGRGRVIAVNLSGPDLARCAGDTGAAAGHCLLPLSPGKGMRSPGGQGVFWIFVRVR